MFIKARAFPGEKEEKIIKKSEDSFDVYVKEKPIMGLANKGILKMLAIYFNVSESKVRLIKGFRERNKIFEII